jgi:hypothetical protein
VAGTGCPVATTKEAGGGNTAAIIAPVAVVFVLLLVLVAIVVVRKRNGPRSVAHSVSSKRSTRSNSVVAMAENPVFAGNLETNAARYNFFLGADSKGENHYAMESYVDYAEGTYNLAASTTEGYYHSAAQEHGDGYEQPQFVVMAPTYAQVPKKKSKREQLNDEPVRYAVPVAGAGQVAYLEPRTAEAGAYQPSNYETASGGPGSIPEYALGNSNSGGRDVPNTCYSIPMLDMSQGEYMDVNPNATLRGRTQLHGSEFYVAATSSDSAAAQGMYAIPLGSAANDEPEYVC